MSWRITVIALLAAFALALLPAGCGGDDEPSKPQPAESTLEEQPRQANEAAEGNDGKRDEQRPRAERETRDRNEQGGFNGRPFDRVVGRLPIKEPPLRVRATIQFGDSHRLRIAVTRRYFLCTLSVPERERAVADFSSKAQQLARAAGVDDLRLVVTRLQPTLQNLPKWGTAGPSGVQLTNAGRRSVC